MEALCLGHWTQGQEPQFLTQTPTDSPQKALYARRSPPGFTAWSCEVRTGSHCTDTGSQHKEKQQYADTGIPSWAGVTHRKVTGQELPVILPVMAH